MVDLATIRTAAKAGDWRAAAWGLERRHPGEYGKRETVNITVDVRKQAEQIAKDLGISADELLADAQAIAAEAWGKS